MEATHRLRIEVLSGSGVLGRIGQAIGNLGGKIDIVDLQDPADGVGIIEAVVSVPQDNASPQQVASALTEVGAGRLKLWETIDEAIDPVLRSIRWACAIVQADASFLDDEVERVIGEVCATADAWLLAMNRMEPLKDALVGLEQGNPTMFLAPEVPLDLPASFSGRAWVLAVPDGRLEPENVAVIVRPSQHSFTKTEINRVEAVLMLGRQAAADRSAKSSGLDGGPWLDLSDVSLNKLQG